MKGNIEVVIELGVILLMVLAVFAWVIYGAAASLASRFKHYSLRTLLISTTIIAVILGLGVIVLR